jgi:hypothetical protein
LLLQVDTAASRRQLYQSRKQQSIIQLFSAVARGNAQQEGVSVNKTFVIVSQVVLAKMASVRINKMFDYSKSFIHVKLTLYSNNNIRCK